jgi:RNA methyltransferase, TrmH family
MQNIEISSPTNERIKRLVRLRDRTHRDSEGVFLVEGARLMSRAQANGFTPLEVYVTPGHALESHPSSTIVEPTVLDKASYRSQAEGLIAVFAQFSTSLALIKTGPVPLILIAESIEKPGNLGAIFRTADAVGATALITTGPGVDPFNPNVIRSSTGAIFSVPYAHCDLSDLHRWLVDNTIELVVTSPDAQTTYWETNLTGPLAILVGSEDRGVSDQAATMASKTVAIPMLGISDSLNVSVTAALLAFETRRQRSSQSH